MLQITAVEKNSIAEELDIRAGDFLIGFDGEAYNDILDLFFYESQNDFVLNIMKADGTYLDFEIEKDDDELLGIAVKDEIKTRVCKNKCVFCFVDQLPDDRKMRNTLRLKDDDWRMSAIYGNFVTLTNLKSGELERIIRQKISPLYISVHSTDKDIRARMLGNPKSDIMPLIRKLHESGIKIHAQVVLCPGYNTGADLIRSIENLSGYAESLAFVPVGVTRYTKGLRALTKEEAEEAVDHIEYFQKVLLAKSGSRFCFAADELYIIAEREVPAADSYEGFVQIENGVGMIAKLKDEVNDALKETRKSADRKITLVTGRAAAEFIKETAAKVVRGTKITAEVAVIDNEFFGSSVTVSGLVTGGDILRQLTGRDLGEVLIPCNMLKEYEDIFLDDMTLDMLKTKLNAKITVVDNTGEDFVSKILGETIQK